MEDIVDYAHEDIMLVDLLAKIHHETPAQVRRKLMEKAIDTINLAIRKVFGEKFYKIPEILRLELWTYALKKILPYYWVMVYDKEDYVSPEEVIRELPRNVIERLRDMYYTLMKTEKVLLEA